MPSLVTLHPCRSHNILEAISLRCAAEALEVPDSHRVLVTILVTKGETAPDPGCGGWTRRAGSRPRLDRTAQQMIQPRIIISGILEIPHRIF